MITSEVRFSYAHVFEAAATPNGDLKYSVCIMIPKDDKKGLAAINAAIQEAVKKGLENGKIPKAKVKGIRIPLRDGDAEVESGDRGAEFKGMMFFNASSKNPPGVVDSRLAPLMSADQFYSGCWGRADINFFPYSNAGNIGVGAGLNNVMKSREGDRLDGRQKAEDAFAQFASAEGPAETVMDLE